MGARGSNILLALVAILSVATLVPPMCVRDYQEWMQRIDNPLRSAVSYNPFLTSNATVFTIVDVSEAGNSMKKASTIDMALQAQKVNGYPLEPVSDVLPRRLFVIYGLESSGTTFTARTIATALGISKEKNKGDFVLTDDGKDHVQHISLPWGLVSSKEWGFQTKYSKPLPMIPVFYPKPCQMNPPKDNRQDPPKLTKPPEQCRDFMEEEVLTRPYRFFVNMTTHIQWYRERGVLVYPIMVVRDPLLHFVGVTNPKGHAPNDRAAYGQFEMGRAIMIETMEKGLNPVMVSYETMLTLQEPYLRQLYDKVGIESDYIPKFKNGNTKYLRKARFPGQPPLLLRQSFRGVELELMAEDNSLPDEFVPSRIRTNPNGQPKNMGMINRAPTPTSVSKQKTRGQAPGTIKRKPVVKRTIPGQ